MRLTVLAPAKINLGLEIVGKRPDGYHELVTIFCAISRFDRVTVTDTHAPDDVTLAADNLAIRALAAGASYWPNAFKLHVALEKRIPAAAGLGGGSSDAAAVLRAILRLAFGAISDAQLASPALDLGSDVPFLLDGGLAMATGRGEILQPLPYRPIYLVVIAKAAPIASKTATMFASLLPDDFTDGSTTRMRAEQLLQGGNVPAGSHLFNAFERALYHLFPEVAALAARVSAVGGLPVNISGAGPSLYTIVPDMVTALALSSRLRLVLRDIPDVDIFPARSVKSIPIGPIWP